MDPRISQSRSSSQHLRPPPHHPRTTSSSTTSTPSHSPSPSSRAPITAHPTCTISDSVTIQGTHPISIGAGTIIHPRARIYSYDGPIIIGDGCIICEKTVIGIAPSPGVVGGSGNSSSGGEAGTTGKGEGIPIRISHSVSIGPQVTIFPGAHIHSAAVIEALAVINRRVSIGANSKVGPRCEIVANTAIGEWMVVWGAGSGLGLRRKVRKQGKVASKFTSAHMGSTPVAGAGGEKTIGIGDAPEARAVEAARLMVLKKEREALAKFIAPSAGRRR